MKPMTSIEIKEEYGNGKRVFEDVGLEYAQMENWNLDGLVFKNCKFNFTSFRFTSLRNSKFVNCDFFFHSFFSADLEGVVFDNCKIEGSRMDSAKFDKTVFKNCHLSYILMLDTNKGGVDITTSTQFGMIFTLQDITQDFISGALKSLMPTIETLDPEVKNHIKSVIKRYSGETGVGMPNIETFNSSYKKTDASYKRSSTTYGAFSGVFDEIINYGKSDVYKDNYTVYDKKKGYPGKTE